MQTSIFIISDPKMITNKFFFSFKGDKVDTNRLKAVLENLGIELNPNQHSSLLNMLPVDGKCHGYHRGLLDSLVLCLCKKIPKHTKNA